jgi:site-specific DNA-methyltransferase (adenine-specific)
MRSMSDNFLDLVITSPPYDNLRKYKGYLFAFEDVAKELFRVTKKGGVVVWIVSDATIKGSESGSSFRQALFFKECGFNIHDTMIYAKHNPMPQFLSKRYTGAFEFMFVFSKGTPKCCNYLKEDCLHIGNIQSGKRNTASGLDSVHKDKPARVTKDKKIRSNIWTYKVGINQSYTDKFASKHPAIFPEKLALDHILSWSNEGDLIYDPFMGSGTTAKMAVISNRNYIGSEISEEFCQIAKKRVESVFGLF